MTASTDTSRRFILPQADPLPRNLAALWGADPVLAEKIEMLGEGDVYSVEPSKAGPPTVVVPSAEGRPIYLHSRHQPLDEAAHLIDHADLDGKIAFFIHGFGLGYHVEQLFDRASDEALLCVFEPDLNLLRTALEHRDLSRLFESRRLMFFDRADKGDLYGRLTSHMALMSLGIETLVHPPSLQRHTDFHRQMQTWITEFATCCRTNLNTLVLNGRRTAENLSRNIGWYVAAPSLSRLKDRYRGAPAIIVSAGPSLRKNKHLLVDTADKAVLIAVQTTLQPLLDMGITPHFMTSLDYHDVCTRFFEKLPQTLTTELVAEPKASSAIFRLNPGPLSLLGNEFSEGLVREMKLRKTPLRAGATVAHLAYYLAEHLGCDPIIFVGQDLGFRDGLCYTPGTSYEDVWRPELSRFCTVEMKQWEQIVRDRPILRQIRDQQGRPMYTEERLFSYLQQFERDFAQTDRCIIDATEGGAMKRGARVMSLSSAIQEFCTSPLASPAQDHPGLRWDRIEECVRSLESRRREAQQIEQISRETLPLLNEVHDHLEDQPRVNRAIGRIDKLRARMDELSPCYDLITQLTQFTELRRFHNDRRLAASKITGIERQRRQITRDIENVQAVIDAAMQFQRLMGEVIVSLRTQSRREAA